MNKRWLFVLLLWSLPALAVEQIEVVALMPGMVVMRIDGVQRTLKMGATSPEGVKLVAADSASATVESEGHTRKLTLGSGSLGGGYKAPTKAEVRLSPDPSGMYRTHGSINGMPLEFLVDTGATVVAMNSNTARQLGIDYRLNGKPSMVQTASGTEKVYVVTLDQVKVGGVVVRNVEAAVLEGGFPTMPLLGMSFLGKLEMIHEGKGLVLHSKW